MASTQTESRVTAEERAYLMSLINEGDKAHGRATAPKKPKDAPPGSENLNTESLDPSLGFSVAALGWKTTE